MRVDRAHEHLPLDFAAYANPTLSGSWWPSPHESHFAVSDVFFAEVAILSRICLNMDALFTVGRADIFRCNLDRTRFFQLTALIANSEV